MIDIWRHWWDGNSLRSDAHQRPAQPRHIGIKARLGRKKKKEKRNELENSRGKNQLVESFAKKDVGGGGGAGEIGLSSWMNNEACFQHFKGKGEKATAKLRYVLCVILIPN